MIILKLERDQARNVQLHFFPYLEMVCEMKIEHSQSQDDVMNARMIYSILNEARKLFEKKLFGVSNKLKFKFTDAQAIVLFKLFIAVPFQSDQIWLINLRSFITDTLHRQLCEPA